jgi:hypothetical protein
MGVDVRSSKILVALFLCLACSGLMLAQTSSAADEASRKLALDMFKQLIEI